MVFYTPNCIDVSQAGNKIMVSTPGNFQKSFSNKFCRYSFTFGMFADLRMIITRLIARTVSCVKIIIHGFSDGLFFISVVIWVL